MDSKQTLYKQLGLGRKCLVLRSHKVGEFGRKKLLGVKIPPVYPGDDILLMGGRACLSALLWVGRGIWEGLGGGLLVCTPGDLTRGGRLTEVC